MRTFFSTFILLALSFFSLAAQPQAILRWHDAQTGNDVIRVRFVDECFGVGFTAAGTVIATYDKGDTWHTMALPGREITDVRFLNRDLGAACGENMAMITRDGGQTWRRIDPQLRNANGGFRCIQFTDSLTGFIGSLLGEILLTDDGGETWRMIGVQNSPNIADLDFSDPDRWLAFGDRGLYVSGDQGTTWSTLAEEDRHSYGYARTNGGRTIYASAGSGVVYRINAEDGTQETLQTGIDIDLRAIAAADSNRIVAVGGWGTAVRSGDGGAVWEVCTGLETGKGTALATVRHISDSIWMCAGENGRIYKSVNDGKHWYPVSRPPFGGTHQLVMRDGLHGIILGYDNTLHRTADGGYTWDTVSIQAKDAVLDVDFSDGETLVGVSGRGDILRSTNNGIDWTVVRSDTTNELLGIAFGSDGIGLACGDGIVLRTTDGGLDWRPVMEHVDHPYLDRIAMSPQNRVMMGSVIHPAWYYSGDGGLNWYVDARQINVLEPDPATWDVDFSPSGNVGTSMHDTRMIRVVRNDQNRQIYYGQEEGPRFIMQGLMVNDSVGVGIGNFTLFYTTDAWETIRTIPADINTPLEGLEMTQDGSIFGICRNGHAFRLYIEGLAEIPQEEINREDCTGSVPPQYPEPACEDIRISVGPNPSREELNIRVRKTAPGHLKIAAYSTRGALLAVIHDRAVPIGETNLTWNHARLPRGVCIIRCESRTDADPDRICTHIIKTALQ